MQLTCSLVVTCASNSYVSHDGCYTSMIDYIGLSVERVDSVMHIEIVDDDFEYVKT